MRIDIATGRQRLSSVLTLTLAGAALQMGAFSAHSHEARAGDVTIDHPYAVPSPAGARTGGMYFRRLTNTGKGPERLISATTPIARTIEFHEMRMHGEVMKMRALDAIELPAGAELSVRHGGNLHLMLLDLKQPLKDGDRFPVTLTFERGGRKEVMVWVQKPREAVAAHADHSNH